MGQVGRVVRVFGLHGGKEQLLSPKMFRWQLVLELCRKRPKFVSRNTSFHSVRALELYWGLGLVCMDLVMLFVKLCPLVGRGSRTKDMAR